VSNGRIGFVMPRSVTEAMDCFPDDQQLAAYKVINKYALDGIEPDFDEDHQIAKGIFILAKPFIDSNNRKYENGKKGGRPKNETKPNDNQTETKTKPNDNQSGTNPKANSRRVEELNSRRVEEWKSGTVEEGGSPKAPLTPPGVITELTEADAASLGVEPALCEPVSNWINNRTARGEPLTEGELKSMVSMVKANTVKYGAQAVSDLITENMGNGYKGILWDRLDRKSRDKPRKSVAEQFMEIPL
jgi:hypothetical protein